MFQLTDEQIEKAVNWWADRVCAPTFSGLSPEERKNPCNDTYQFAEILALSMTRAVTDDARQRFIDALKEELRSEEYDPFLWIKC